MFNHHPNKNYTCHQYDQGNRQCCQIPTYSYNLSNLSIKDIRERDKPLTQLQSTCILQQLQNPNINIELRKKIHQIKTQNFLLRQQLSIQRKQLIENSQKIALLQRQLKQSLEELTQNDGQMEKYQFQFKQQQEYILFLENKVKGIQIQVQEANGLIHNQKSYVQSLNQQNIILIQIKQVLIQQNQNLRQSYQEVNSKYLIKQKQIEKFNVEINYLLKDVTNLEQLIYNKNQEILSYEYFLNHKDKQLTEKIKHQVQDQIVQERIWKKLQKYKKKALKYKLQRDELFKEIQQAKQQIGTITLRKYFAPNQEQTQIRISRKNG